MKQILILQVKKPKFKDIKWLAQLPTASKEGADLDLNLYLLIDIILLIKFVHLLIKSWLHLTQLHA